MITFRKLLLSVIGLLVSVSAAQAQAVGRITGTVSLENGRGIANVEVTLDELGFHRMTNARGSFALDDIPEGEYSLTFALGDQSVSKTDVRVEADATTTLEVTVDWKVSFAETISVYSASRRYERIVEAPAAITALSSDEIELGAAPAQIPKLLEFTVGVDIGQSGLYDFNFNIRGLNSSLTRRVATLIDGREISSPIATSQNWAVAGFLTDDLESVELVRGPSAALYGPNTFNGVLYLVTRSPSESQGGMLRLTGGDLDTVKGDFRWAMDLGGGWYAKLLGSQSQSEDFKRSRTESVEYPGLNLEAAGITETRVEISSAAARLDKHLSASRVFSVEAGRSRIDNTLFLLPFGRGYVPRFKMEWARANFSAPRWNLAGYYNTRVADVQIQLGAGSLAVDDSSSSKFELQVNDEFVEGRMRLVGGISYGEKRVDTADPAGRQTTLAERVDSDEQAVFGQFDYDLSSRLKLVLAARWDESSLHESQISPKASLVLSVTPNHTLRWGYNQSFQVPTFIDLFLSLPVGPPIDLSGVEQQFAPLLSGVPLGLEFIPFLALGNEALEVEEIETLEVGYNAILGPRAFLTVDYYHNRMKNFLTNPIVGGNPVFGPYRAPSTLPPPIASLVETTLLSILPGLTNDPVTAAPLFVLSPTNTGEVESQGVELALTYQVHDQWIVDFNYAWFDFEIKEQPLDIQPVQPNTPENKFSLGIAYRSGPLRADVRYRWVEDFSWESGVFSGPVPSYEVVNLSLSYDLSKNWQLGVNASNLFDHRHYEVFGGDILERRVLASVAYSW